MLTLSLLLLPPLVLSEPVPYVDVRRSALNGSDALGLTACDVRPARSLGTIPAGSAVSVADCESASGYTFTVVIRNPQGSAFSVYLGMGSAQCPSQANFNPNSYPAGTWTTANSATNFAGVAVVSVRNLQCTSSVDCCVRVWCNTGGSTCTGLTAAAAYVLPPVPGQACGASSQGLLAVAAGTTLMRGCTGTSNGATQSFTLLNPNGNTLSLILTDGADSQGCGFTQWATGGQYRYFQRALSTTSTSISFSGVPCTASQCCAVIYCPPANDNAGCYGLSYSQSFPSAPAASLAGGVIAAIVIGILVCLAAGAFMRWYYYKPQITTYGNANVVVVNPVSQQFSPIAAPDNQWDKPPNPYPPYPCAVTQQQPPPLPAPLPGGYPYPTPQTLPYPPAPYAASQPPQYPPQPEQAQYPNPYFPSTQAQYPPPPPPPRV